MLPSFCGRDRAEQGVVMTIRTDGFLGVPGCCSAGAGVVASCPPSPAPIPDLPGYMGRSSSQAGRMNGGLLPGSGRPHRGPLGRGGCPGLGGVARRWLRPRPQGGAAPLLAGGYSWFPLVLPVS